MKHALVYNGHIVSNLWRRGSCALSDGGVGVHAHCRSSISKYFVHHVLSHISWKILKCSIRSRPKCIALIHTLNHSISATLHWKHFLWVWEILRPGGDFRGKSWAYFHLKINAVFCSRRRHNLRRAELGLRRNLRKSNLQMSPVIRDLSGLSTLEFAFISRLWLFDFHLTILYK